MVQSSKWGSGKIRMEFPKDYWGYPAEWIGWVKSNTCGELGGFCNSSEERWWLKDRMQRGGMYWRNVICWGLERDSEVDKKSPVFLRSGRQADCCQHEGYWDDAQWHSRVEEACLWGQQSFIWKKDPDVNHWTKGEPPHLQAEGAAGPGEKLFMTCWYRNQGVF